MVVLCACGCGRELVRPKHYRPSKRARFIHGHNRRNPNRRTNTDRTNGAYHLWRGAVFVRDGYRCQVCDTNRHITAHHIYPWKTHPERRYDVSNGITLCGSCHDLTRHREMEWIASLESLLQVRGEFRGTPGRDNPEPSRSGDGPEGATATGRDLLARFRKTEKPCKRCGAIMRLSRWEWDRLYCSMACRKSTVERICATCGGSFHRPAWIVRQQTTRWCSHECYNNRSVIASMSAPAATGTP